MYVMYEIKTYMLCMRLKHICYVWDKNVYVMYEIKTCTNTFKENRFYIFPANPFNSQLFYFNPRFYSTHF